MDSMIPPDPDEVYIPDDEVLGALDQAGPMPTAQPLPAEQLPPMMVEPLPDPDEEYEFWADIHQAIQQIADEMTEPQWPKSYKRERFPKPTEADVLAEATKLESEYAPLRKRMKEDISRLNLEYNGAISFGAFRDFDKDSEEPWVDNAITAEVELLTYALSDREPAYAAEAKRRNEEDIAAKKVDFVAAVRRQFAETHELTFGPLGVEEARTLLITGRLCTHIMWNPDCEDDELPFQQYLVDPTTCYPVFEHGKGLRKQYRKFQTTIEEAIGLYQTPEHDLEDLIRNRDDKGQFTKRKFSPGQHITVIEYWDRRWKMVLFDGKSIYPPAEHDLGIVPFVYSIGGLGLPSYMEDTATGNGTTYVANYSGKDAANPSKGISIVGLMRLPQNQKEALQGRWLRAWQKDQDKPLLIGIDDIAYDDGPPEIDRERKGVSVFKSQHQSVTEMDSSASLGALSPLVQMAQESLSRISLPDSMYGLNEKSNVSGYATNALNASGTVRLVPHLRTLESHYTQVAQMALDMYQNWGYSVEQGDVMGSLSIPKLDPSPYEDKYCDLTPAELRKAKGKVSVSLSQIPIQMLGSVANTATMLMNLGVWDKKRVLQVIGDSNPEKTLKRVRASQVLDDPALVQLQVIRDLEQAGDMEAAAWLRAAWQRTKQQEAQAQQAHSQPQGGTVSAIGESLPGLGQGPGEVTGRPPGGTTPSGLF